MNRRLTGLLIAMLVCSVPCLAKKNAPITAVPRVFSINAAALRDLRVRIANGSFKSPALETLRADADRALKLEPLSVMQKSQMPPSGNKHDYMSLAPYWWPDPAKPDGLPYVRRDGERNPEIRQVRDHETCGRMITATRTLALAYYLLGDERYAAKAASLLRTWFLDPATRMEPNLQYAQAVRGVNEGRGTGLIETSGFNATVDAVGMLAGSDAWTPADQKGMQDWFARYLAWMLTSKNGRDEAAAKNNHGSYYDVQIASFALFIGNRRLALSTLERVSQRITAQLDREGRQPLELERTNALGYSTFNLRALFKLACLGDSLRLNLWSLESGDGKSIRKALDFLTPYVAGEKKWGYRQITPYDVRQIAPLYVIAARKYHDANYERVAQKLNPAWSNDVECVLAGLQ